MELSGAEIAGGEPKSPWHLIYGLAIRLATVEFFGRGAGRRGTRIWGHWAGTFPWITESGGK